MSSRRTGSSPSRRSAKPLSPPASSSAGNVISIPASLFAWAYTLFIGGGLAICLVLCLLWHREDAVKTHCDNWEWFPSVSASIGDNAPEKNVWRCAIALGSGPRTLLAFLTYSLMKRTAYSGQASDAKFATASQSAPKVLLVLDLLRIVAAGMWTYISSTEYNDFHTVWFIVYIMDSVGFSAYHCYAFRGVARYARAHWDSESADLLERSIWWKVVLQMGQGFFYMIMLGIFFGPHRGAIGPYECMAGAYSVYALCEWIMSFCNVAYDWTGVWDFSSVHLHSSWRTGDATKRS